MLHLPEFEGLDFTQQPLVKRWNGANGHIGPVHTVTPMLEMFAGKSKCATVTLMTGILTWGAARLMPFYNAPFLSELIEASFAWHFDWRYFEREAPPYFAAPDEPPEVSAILRLDNFMRQILGSELEWKRPYTPVSEAFHMAHLVTYLLPRNIKPVFKGWLKQLCDRLDAIAAVEAADEAELSRLTEQGQIVQYCDQLRGHPLPPSVLDLSQDLSGRDLHQEAIDSLRTLDHSQNRFLRGPQVLNDLGFQGQPYGVGL